jgi:membrane protease YdiL (CAAX protease family)
MKQLILRFPFWSRILLAFVLGAGALWLSGFVYTLFPVRSYFPFVGESLLVLVTWVLLRTDGERLSALGLNPSFRHLAYLFWGLGVGVLALLFTIWLRTLYTGEVWHLSSAVNALALLKSLYYILPSVIVQELMFRGYLFTKTIKRYGVVWANVLFAFIFMLVHVLDRDVLQSPGQAIFLLVSIPVGHLWFATALLRSKTLLFPIGLHWGNNWAVQHLLGTTDNPQSFFYVTHQPVFTTWPSLLILLLLFNGSFLLVIWAIWKSKIPFIAGKGNWMKG